jgi:hypothetical protein
MNTITELSENEKSTNIETVCKKVFSGLTQTLNSDYIDNKNKSIAMRRVLEIAPEYNVNPKFIIRILEL